MGCVMVQKTVIWTALYTAMQELKQWENFKLFFMYKQHRSNYTEYQSVHACRYCNIRTTVYSVLLIYAINTVIVKQKLCVTLYYKY